MTHDNHNPSHKDTSKRPVIPGRARLLARAYVEREESQRRGDTNDTRVIDRAIKVLKGEA